MFTKSESPAAERNKYPILKVLENVIKIQNNQIPCLKILEIASGTGQHITYFAKKLHPNIFWQPTEFDKTQFSSICAHIQEDGVINVAPPVYVDIRKHYTEWKPVCQNPERSVSKAEPITNFKENFFDYVYNSNLTHISNFDCTEGLFNNSSKLLKLNGLLIMYGPFSQNGVISPESNIHFDKSLRMSNLSWGIRDVQLQLLPLAQKNNLKLVESIDMPSNNKILLWQKIKV